MEQYYIPSSFDLEVADEFFIYWVDNYYNVADGCPSRPTSGTTPVDILEISPWGYTRDFGVLDLANDTHLLVGEGCDSNSYNIATVAASRSIFDAPNFSPYEPIYFILFGFFAIWLVIFAIKLMLGKGYR